MKIPFRRGRSMMNSPMRSLNCVCGFVSALNPCPFTTPRRTERPFGLAPSTASAKAPKSQTSSAVSAGRPMALPELIEDNPALWTFSLNGFIVDARNLPQEIQQEAAKRGLIPYVPPLKGLDAPKEDSDTPDPLQQNLALRNSRAANAMHPSANADPPADPDDFSNIYDRFRTV